MRGTRSRSALSTTGGTCARGHVEQGKFSIVCSGGEYEINFTAIIEKPYVMTAYGKVQSTDDFKRLAIKDYSEAQKLFRSREFYEVLKYENPRTFHLYDNMRKWSLDEQAMEEFLVGIKQKECIFLTLQGEGMLFEDLKEATKGSFTVIKNTWGFMPIHIKAEGGFITVARPEITTDDFVGNVYELEFVVGTEHLHAGRNFGRISLVTPYETLSYDVEVFQGGERDENHGEIEFLAAQILKEHIACEAGRIDLNTWTDSAVEKSKRMRQYAPLDDGLQLFQAHIYIRGGRMEEAKWILENYNYNRFAIGKDPTTNAYYLFLTALIRPEGSHAERVLDEIGRTYLRHQDSWQLLMMLLLPGSPVPGRLPQDPRAGAAVLRVRGKPGPLLPGGVPVLPGEVKPVEKTRQVRAARAEFRREIQAAHKGSGPLCGEPGEPAEDL